MAPRSSLGPSLIVAIALTVMATDLGILLANRHEDNRTTFYAFTRSWSDYATLRQEWRPRILSNYLASQVALATKPLASTDEGRMNVVAAVWTGFWYALISAALLAFTGRHAVFYLFAYFSCVAFGYLPTVNARIYPWDLPALAVFTLFILFVRRGWAMPLLVLPAVGMFFKETAMVLCVAILLSSGTWRQRVGRFAIAATLCLAVKLAIDAVVGISMPGMSMTTGDGDGVNLALNLRAILHVNRQFLVHPALVNAGTLVALLLLPRRDRFVVMSQVVALIFVANLLLFGRIVEYRIWFEMIPLSLFALERTFLQEEAPRPEFSAPLAAAGAS